MLHKPDRIKAEVMDQTGRKVAESGSDPQPVPPGNWIWTWKGIDVNGLDVPPGVYLLRVLTGSTLVTSRLVCIPER